MLVRDNITINQYSDNQWILSPPNGVHFIINKPVKELFELLVSTSNFDDVLIDFNTKNNTNLSVAEFEQIVNKSLKGKAILKNDESEFISSNSNTLRFKLPIFSSKVTNILGNYFSILCKKPFFIILFSIGFLLALGMTIAQWDVFVNTLVKSSLTNVSIIIPAIIFFTLFHELGHVSACKACKLETGEIGFGINLFFPVFYADVTQIWKASRTQRIITNLSGIYFQFILGILLTTLYWITDAQIILVMLFVNAFSAILQLNPFLRHDGYWVVSDLFHLPNLMQNADNEVLKLFSFKQKNKLNLKLLIYGVLNNTWIWVISIFLCVRYYPYITKLPFQAIELIKNAFSDQKFDFQRFDVTSLYALLFYVLFSTKISILVKKIITKTFRKTAPQVSIPLMV